MVNGINIKCVTATGQSFDLSALALQHPNWAQDIEALGLVEGSSGQHFTQLKSQTNSVEADLVVVDSCSSTMELAAQYGSQGLLPAWGAVMAVQQESGRGQLRRHWVSEAGNMHVSFLLPAMQGIDPLWNRLLPLVMGWCLRNGLRELGAETVLKWPNDLIQVQNNVLYKTCGLLIEDRGGQVIAGTGFNLVMSPAQDKLRAGAAFPAGILNFSDKVFGPLRLWCKLVKRLKKEYQALLDNTNPSDFTERLSQELLWIGERVVVREGDEMRQVILLGLAGDGGLRILGDNGEEVLYSGSVSNISG